MEGLGHAALVHFAGNIESANDRTDGVCLADDGEGAGGGETHGKDRVVEGGDQRRTGKFVTDVA